MAMRGVLPKCRRPETLTRMVPPPSESACGDKCVTAISCVNEREPSAKPTPEANTVTGAVPGAAPSSTTQVS
eukprot:scaffold25307_cov109-Isochrysis_galbana.AAC.13